MNIKALEKERDTLEEKVTQLEYWIDRQEEDHPLAVEQAEKMRELIDIITDRILEWEENQ